MSRMEYLKAQEVFKKQHRKVVASSKKQNKMPHEMSTTLPKGMEVTPEIEKERVLIDWQGTVKDVVINDRTKDGKFVKIGGDWFGSDSIKIVHKF